jgi:1-acyl-sn-glycerol-3-phosphate acyltransferase
MIRTIFIFVYIIIVMIILIPIGIVAMLFYFIGLRMSMMWLVYQLARGWSYFILKFLGCPIIVTGQENIPKKGGVCFVSNHCGFLDIVLLFAYCGRPVGFIAKKELIFVPILNAWIYMVGGQFIDRSSPRKAVRSINKGVERIKRGGGMIIFPEGHRSKGRGLLPFHPGSLKLATMAEAPIVPVALEGSYEVFEKNYRAAKNTMKVTFCKPIDTAGIPTGDRKQVLCDRIYSVIKEKLEAN